MKRIRFEMIAGGLFMASLGLWAAHASAEQAHAEPSKEDHADHDKKSSPEEHAEHEAEGDHKDHAEHEEKGGHADEEPWADRVGAGKAVEAFEEAGRLKLAEKAIRRMGIQASPQRKEGSHLRLPLAAVQKSKGKAFIYVAQAGRWYERRTATVLKRDRSTALLSVKLAKHELIVTEGSASLRAAELDLLTGETAGHGH